MRFVSTALTALLLTACTSAEPQQVTTPPTTPPPVQTEPEPLPCLSLAATLPDRYKGEGLFALCNDGYAVRYSLSDRVPRLVAEQLTREKLQGSAERQDDFRADTRLPLDRRADLNDYRGSGYDRGHLAPAADFKYSVQAMSDSFLLSNIAPQEPTFNRNAWAGLESATRACAKERGSLTVLTGTLGKSGSLHGQGRVSIPASFYKLWTDGADYRLWVMPNIATGKLSGAEFAQYELSLKDMQSYWPEFRVNTSLKGEAAGRLCPGAIPLKKSATPASVPAPAPAQAPAPTSSVYYPNCSAARDAGAAPLYRGQAGYRPQMDGDSDGVACE